MSKASMRVLTSDLEGYLKQGYHSLNLFSARIIAANAIGNLIEGGTPDGNTSPSLLRVNGATDKQSRLAWAATGVDELQFPPFELPPDLDLTAPIQVRLRLGKDANANTVTVAVGAFFNVGDTNAGAATPTIAQAVAVYTVNIAAADIPAAGGSLTITLIPSAHAGDALYLYSATLVYTRRA